MHKADKTAAAWLGRMEAGGELPFELEIFYGNRSSLCLHVSGVSEEEVAHELRELLCGQGLNPSVVAHVQGVESGIAFKSTDDLVSAQIAN